jgi:hypothetical protein
MTLEEIKNLSNDEINRALQTALRGEVIEPVDYCRDLNALQADEAFLTAEQRADQIVVLAVNISIPIESEPPRAYVAADGPIPSDKALSPELYVKWGIYKALQFTARQRAEALLWVLAQKPNNDA